MAEKEGKRFLAVFPVWFPKQKHPFKYVRILDDDNRSKFFSLSLIHKAKYGGEISLFSASPPQNFADKIAAPNKITQYLLVLARFLF